MNTLGYGRYKDDPNHVGCPRAKTDMTPCAARDGSTACTDGGECVGCGEHPADLLTALVREITPPPTHERPATRISMRVPAGQTERFAKDAFTAQVGKTVPIAIPGGRGTGKVLAAEVVDSGRAVLLTLEVDEATARSFRTVDRGHYSVGFTPSKGITIKPLSATESFTSGRDGGGPNF